MHVDTSRTCQYNLYMPIHLACRYISYMSIQLVHVDTSGTCQYSWYILISGPEVIMENYTARACQIVQRSSASKMWSFINQGGHPIGMVLLSPPREKRVYMPKTIAYNHDDTCHDVQCQGFFFCTIQTF